MSERGDSADEQSRIRLLERMPIFGGVSEPVLALLLECMNSVAVTKGDYFFREGDPGISAFVLEEGSVSVLKEWGGRIHLLRELERGDCFGEVALLDFRGRSASIRADQDCRAIELSASDLLEVANQNTEQFAMLYMNIGRELARRLRDADQCIFRAQVEADLVDEDYELRLD